MPLTHGLNHVSLVTSDLDRLVGFYCEMFEAEVVQVANTPFGGRIAIVWLGPGTALNVFEIPDNPNVTGRPEMFERGHIDHFGIAASDADSFWSLRERLVTGGHSSGEVTDFGPIIGFDFTDPDGMTAEVDLVLDPALAGGHEPRPYHANDAVGA